MRNWIFICLALSCLVLSSAAQELKQQRGVLYKQATNIRLGSIRIVNKRTAAQAKSNIYGAFSISAAKGDSLLFTSTDFITEQFVVNDLEDKIIYLKPVIILPEVVIKANSIKADLGETQKVYRSKGVFYTGEPHYYYLFLKPMTFIYENFKSEVKEARKFRKYSVKEMEYYEVAKRFNDLMIKKQVAITDSELIAYKIQYRPPLTRLNSFNDIDLINYIKKTYAEFLQNKTVYIEMK